MHSKPFYTSKVGLGYSGNSAICLLKKKLILIYEFGCVWGIEHFIIQPALLDYSFHS